MDALVLWFVYAAVGLKGVECFSWVERALKCAPFNSPLISARGSASAVSSIIASSEAIGQKREKSQLSVDIITCHFSPPFLACV